MSEHEYWTFVRSIVERGHQNGRPKHEIREEIVDYVTTASHDGEVWAAEVMQRWERTAADEDYTKVFKDLNTVTYIRADGRRARKTVAYSRPKRSKEDGAIIGQQVQAWWYMDRAAVAELRRDLFGQSESLADVVAALDRILAAMDRHPDCKTALEAWEADGHDVGEIDLGEAV